MKRAIFAAMAVLLLAGCDPLRAGHKLMAEGKYEDAARFFLEKTRENPQDHLAFNELGYCYARLNMEDAAVNAYTRATQLKPDFFPAYLNLGTLNLKKGNIDGAYYALRKAVELNPESETAHVNYAWTLVNNWKVEEAERQYQEILRVTRNKDQYKELAQAIAKKKALKQRLEEEHAKAMAARAAAGNTADPKAGGTPEPKAPAAGSTAAAPLTGGTATPAPKPAAPAPAQPPT